MENIDLTALYQMQNDQPKNFILVLRNIYGHELQMLKDEYYDAINSIAKETGKDRSRDKFVIDDLEKFEQMFNGPINIAKFFRKTEMGIFISADDLITNLKDMQNRIISARKGFDDFLRNLGKQQRGGKITEEDAQAEFYECRDSLFTVLNGVLVSLDELDEKI